MRWKKVSEHPLPAGDGDTIYILKSLKGKFHATTVPHDVALLIITIIEWYEFNPTEIEDPELIQAQREENDRDSDTIKRCDTYTKFIQSERQAQIELAGLNATKADWHGSVTGVESSDGDNLTSEELQYFREQICEVPECLKGSAKANSACVAEFDAQTAFKEWKQNQQPSWEETFRWETARDILCAFLSNPNLLSQDFGSSSSLMNDSIHMSYEYFDRLKRGRK